MTDKVEGAPFNMAMMYYMELHELRRMKSRAVIAGDFHAYFRALEEIYIGVSFKLDKKEKEVIEDMLKKAKDHMSNDAPGGAGVRLRQFGLNQAQGILQEIDMSLLRFMHKYNMIFPDVKMGGLEDLDKVFGLTHG